MSIPIIQMLLAVSSAQELDALLDTHSVTFGSFTSKGSKPHLTRDGGGTDGDRQKWTFSAWVKRHTFSDAVQVIFSHGSNSNGEGYIGFNTDDALYFGNDNQNNFVASGRKFRDSGWYHIVWAVDSTQASADNRWKIYINGELMPASDYGSPNITQNGSGFIQHYASEAMDPCIGERLRHHFNSANFSAPFKGQIAQVNFIDGAQKAPSDFAKTKDGVYRPIEYTGTFGTNGYYLPFDGSTPIGKAATGQGSDWTPKYFGGSMPVSKATGGLPILNTINEGHIIVPGNTKDYGTETPQFIKDSGCVGFNGLSNWLKSPVGTDMDFGTGDFTVECWVYVTKWDSANSNNPSGMNVLCRASTNAANTGFLLWFDNSGYLKCELDVGNSATQLNTGTTTNGISQGKWTHLAVTRAGTAAKLFVDGVVRAQATDSTNISGNNDLVIGSDMGNSAYFFNGFISNLRIVKGTAVYSGSASNGTQVFTPPTEPLENVTNTKLICCNSSKSPYHSSVGVVTHPQSPNDGTIWSSKVSLASGGWQVEPDRAFNGTLDPGFRAMTTGNAVLVTFSGVSIPCKVVEVYVENNYPSTCTVTISGNTYTSSSGSIHRFVQSGNLTQLTVVNNGSGGRTYFEGVKIDGVILKDGSTENNGCTAIESEVAGSCVLAMPMAGGGHWGTWWSTYDISDEISGGRSIPTTMMTQSSCNSWTGNSNYYGAAHNFDGADDYIKPQTSDTHFQWGRGDFTVEAWVYPEANGSDPQGYYRRIFMTDGPSQNATNNPQITIAPTSGVVNVWTGGSSGTELDILGTTKITENTWHHVAMVRRDGTVKLYVNGVEEGSASSWYNFQPQVDQGYNFKAQPYIGSYGGSQGDFYGRMQDVRAYKGVAKYQQNFTVGSTTPNLLAASTYINESESSDNNPISTPTTGSVYLDGTNDMVRIYGGSSLTMGTGEFTVEGWFHPSMSDSNPNDGIWQIHTNASGYGNDTGGVSQQWEKTGGSVRVNNMMDGNPWYNVGEAQGNNESAGGKWYHVAMTRNSSGKVKSWINGKENGSFQNAVNLTGTTFALGAYWSTSNFFNGHLSNFRVLKGCSLYNHEFTPPTKALVAMPGSVNEAGTVWSDYCTATPSGWYGPNPITNWFDGSETTSANHNASNDTITFSPPDPLSGLLRVYGFAADYSISVNGKDTGVDMLAGSSNNQHWIEVGSFDSITEIKFTYTGSGGAGWYGTKISLNGELLLNPTFAVAKTALICANDSENPLQATLPMLTNRTTHTITNHGCVASDDNPFGTESDGSVFFDGSNDYLSVANNNLFTFDSNDFSIELWLKSKMDTGTYQNFLATRGAAGVTTGWTFSIESNGTIGFYTNGHQFTAGGLVKANEWTHIALERRGGTLKCYQDGKQIATSAPTTQNFTNNSFTIGIHNDASGGGWFSGWISNVRLTREHARVHGEDNSTPVPGKAYTMGGSSFLGCQSKTDVTANVPREDAGIRLYGKPRATTFNPFDSNKPKAGKYATLNQLESPDKSNGTLDDGNLFLYGDDYVFRKSNIWLGKTGPTTGKFYWEVYSISDQEGVAMGSEMIPYCGFTTDIEQDGGEIVGATTKAWFGGGGATNNGPYLKKYDVTSSTDTGIFGGMGIQTYGFAIDLDNRHLTFYADGRPISGDDSIPDPKTTYIIPCAMATNSGGGADWSDTIWNFGQKAWKYPPPQGYVGISYQNAHNTSIKPEDNFGIIKWSGTQNFGDILSYGFEPAFVWMKQYNGQRDWISSDIVTGIGCHLELNDLGQQSTTTQYPYLSKVSSAGAHLYGGSSSGGNINGRDYIGYAWKGGHPVNKSLTNGGVQFDGSGDALSFSDNSDFAMGTGDFTVECWIRPRSFPGSYNAVIDCRDTTSQATGWILGVAGSSGSGGTGNLYVYNDAFELNSGSSQIALDTWSHVAYVRSSGTHALYVNGVQKDTSSSSHNYTVDSCKIAGAYDGAEFWNGYISNVRIVKGTAVYTGAFTPPLEPLTNVTNTKLLCCQDLTDSSVGAVKPGTITVVGGAFQQNIGGPTLRYCKDEVSYAAMSSIYNGHDHALVTGCSVNTEGGFSVITYKANGNASTIPHGLSKAPSFIITKSLNESGSPSWSSGVYHVDGSYSGAQMYMGHVTNGSSAQRSDTNVYTGVDAAGFAIGNWAGINQSGTSYVSYCWHDLDGLQKFGKFSGSGGNDGSYVHLGFRPAMVVVKKYNGTGKWACSDDVRNDWNKTWGSDLSLYMNSDAQETSSSSLNIDLLSGGFKLRSNNAEYNDGSGWYIYCAWARSTGLQALGR